MRFAIIGCGQEGSKRAEALSLIDGAVITVFVDAVAERAAALASQYSAESSTDSHSSVVRSDVDAVIIATSNNLHSPAALAAARAGKHILCERPLARNPSEGEQMAATARENGVVLWTGFRTRYTPVIDKALQTVSSGTIGRPILMRGRTGRGGYAVAPPSDWMVDCDISGGGTLMDNGMDLINLCRLFMGDFRQVMGRTATLMWPIEPCEDNAFAILTRSDNISAQVHSSWTDWQGYLSFDVIGTEGYIHVDYDEAIITIGTRPSTGRSALGEVIDLSSQPDRSYVIEIEEFIKYSSSGTSVISAESSGLEALIIAHAIYKSSVEGVSVKI